MGTKDEKAVQRQAVEAALRLLERKYQERERLVSEIARIDAAIATWEAAAGKRLKKNSGPVGSIGITPRARARKGQVVRHVEAVLTPEQPMTERELRQAIQDKFDIEYRRSAVYTVLQRGKDKRRYEQVGEKWRKVA